MNPRLRPAFDFAALRHAWLWVLLSALMLQACGTNPVTGKREIQLISESQEIAMGKENYLYARQSQGGAYVVDPALSEYVNDIGQRLVKVSHRPDLPYEFVVLNNSTPNAWALPGGKIAINRGLLLELEDEAQLAAVLAHEIVHAAARHGAKNVERGMALQAGIFAVGAAVASSDYGEFADLAVGAAAVASNLTQSKYGRSAELESDRYGMEYMAKAGYDPMAAVDLQQTFVRLSKGRNPSWLEGLFASHPPSQDRVDANRETAARLKVDGKRNRAEYQRRLARVQNTEPAYELYEKGRKALKEEDFSETYGYARQALRIEPEEAHFHSLLGDARLGQERYRDAVRHYSRALSKNDAFYYYYRQRGLARQELKQLADAREDLSKSLELLPTALAHYALGNISLSGNQVPQAIEHFRSAAGADSQVGRLAQAQLVRLDLPRDPERYLQIKAAVDSRGRLIVQVGNRAPVSVRDVVVEVYAYDRRGTLVARDRVQVRGPLGSRKVAQRVTDIRTDNSAIANLKTRVTHARMADSR